MARVLTIGEFARASRLSPKALRLYDELGLLTPARVDPWTGYRFYHPQQLERARLVAWLRRLGMPLARIRVVCELAPAAAATEVAAFWAQAEADLASRARDAIAAAAPRRVPAVPGRRRSA
jgi:DNA-binding transcriptional MerR regulator